MLGIVGVLLALLFATWSSIRQRQAMLLCQSNLRSIGQLMAAYAADHRGRLVPFHPPTHVGRPITHVRESWATPLLGEEGLRLALCPTAKSSIETRSYLVREFVAGGWLRVGVSPGNPNVVPSDVVIAGENVPGTNDEFYFQRLEYGQLRDNVDRHRHGRLGSNLLWMDFRVDNGPEVRFADGTDSWTVSFSRK